MGTRTHTRTHSFTMPRNSELIKQIEYSEKYADKMYEYRHVILPKAMVRSLPKAADETPNYDGAGVARNWSPAKSWVGALRSTPPGTAYSIVPKKSWHRPRNGKDCGRPSKSCQSKIRH